MPSKMKSKKSQGLSINVIIIAAIALVALVVIIAIFTNTTGKAAKNIGSCITKGGKCAYDLPNDKCGKDAKGVDYPVSLIVSGGCKNKDNNLDGLCCLKISNN